MAGKRLANFQNEPPVAVGNLLCSRRLIVISWYIGIQPRRTLAGFGGGRTDRSATSRQAHRTNPPGDPNRAAGRPLAATHFALPIRAPHNSFGYVSRITHLEHPTGVQE